MAGLLEQDRALARQRRVEQLEAAADRVTRALCRRLAELEEILVRRGRSPPGAMALRARAGSIESRPNGLLYNPFVSAAREAPPAVFASTHALEFRHNNPAAVVAAHQPLTDSAEPVVRAAALARLGRNPGKSGPQAQALQVHE